MEFVSLSGSNPYGFGMLGRVLLSLWLPFRFDVTSFPRKGVKEQDMLRK